MRSKLRFQALRDFTLESGQQELERLKAKVEAESASLSRQNSIDSTRSPSAARSPSLGNVPEESNAFAIGDDEEDEDEDHVTTPTVGQSSTQFTSRSRTPSLSSAEDAVPLQLRGMSEKARGKMPMGQPSFSRQNSTTSLNSLTPTTIGMNGSFTPTAEWVRERQPHLRNTG